MRVHLAAMAEYRVTPGHVAAWAKGKQAGGKAAYLLRAESPRSRPATRRSPTEALSQWEMGGHRTRRPASRRFAPAAPSSTDACHRPVATCETEATPGPDWPVWTRRPARACRHGMPISRRIGMPVASARSGYRRVARADRFSRHNKTGVADGCTGKESGHRHRASSGVSRLLST